MQAVQDQGGLACYVGVGTDHPGGHHTSTFDVMEGDIAVGIDVPAERTARDSWERHALKLAPLKSQWGMA
jgi:hypothetical protein